MRMCKVTDKSGKVKMLVVHHPGNGDIKELKKEAADIILKNKE